MKVVSISSYCSIILCLFLVKTSFSSPKGGEKETITVPVSAAKAKANSTFYPVYFKHLVKSNYNWAMKTLSPDYSITKHDDGAGAISNNALRKGEEGTIRFDVSDTKSEKAIGLFPYGTEIDLSKISVGVRQQKDRFFFMKNGRDVKELVRIPVGSTVKLVKSRDEVTVLVNDSPVYTLNGFQDDQNLYVGASFGQANSSYINLSATFRSDLDINSILVQPEGVEGKGSIVVKTSGGSETYCKWGETNLLNTQEFEQAKINWDQSPDALQAFDYNTYLKGFPSEKNNLDHGRYALAITDLSGSEIQLDVDVNSEARWTGDEGVSITSTSITKTGKDNRWTTGQATSDNVFHPGRRGIVNFRYNQNGEGAIGLRSLRENQKEGYAGLTFGFYFIDNKAIPVHNGRLQSSEEIRFNQTDYFGFEVENGKVIYLKNGSKLFEIREELEFKHGLDISLVRKDSKFEEIRFVFVPKWPILEFEQTNSICGKIVQQYSLKIKQFLYPKGSYTYNYTWRNESGDIVSSGMELTDVPPGQYNLTYTVIFPNGTGQSVYHPITYLVGYKAFWNNMVETENAPTTNAIRNTLESFNSNIHTGETSNYLDPGSNEWIYFEVAAPVNNAGTVVYPTLFDRLYLLDFKPYGSPSYYLRAAAMHLGGTNQVLSIYGGSALFHKTVSPGDKVLIKITGGNSVRLSVNGQNINSVNGNIVEPFIGISASSIIGYRASFNSAFSFNSKIGPHNVITSFPCADMAYLDLKRQVDGSFYPARLNTLGFRYMEEYLPASGTLNYRILDRNNEDVFVTNSVTQPDVFRLVGDNKCEIDLSTHRSILPSGYYILEVTNDKNEKRYMRFRLY